MKFEESISGRKSDCVIKKYLFIGDKIVNKYLLSVIHLRRRCINVIILATKLTIVTTTETMSIISFIISTLLLKIIDMGQVTQPLIRISLHTYTYATVISKHGFVSIVFMVEAHNHSLCCNSCRSMSDHPA